MKMKEKGKRKKEKGKDGEDAEEADDDHVPHGGVQQGDRG